MALHTLQQPKLLTGVMLVTAVVELLLVVLLLLLLRVCAQHAGVLV